MKQHGFNRPGKVHPIYNSWSGAKNRCLRLKDKDYQNYGGRGIKFCDRWLNFRNFRDDMFPTWKAGLQLDRIDVNGNYEPGNCKWSTRSEQAKNTRRASAFQSKVEGVYWSPRNKKWMFSKSFLTKEEAEAFAQES